MTITWYEVIHPGIPAYISKHDRVDSAKAQARKYENAQLVEHIGQARFVRFITINGRLKRI